MRIHRSGSLEILMVSRGISLHNNYIYRRSFKVDAEYGQRRGRRNIDRRRGRRNMGGGEGEGIWIWGEGKEIWTEKREKEYERRRGRRNMDWRRGRRSMDRRRGRINMDEGEGEGIWIGSRISILGLHTHGCTRVNCTYMTFHNNFVFQPINVGSWRPFSQSCLACDVIRLLRCLR